MTYAGALDAVKLKEGPLSLQPKTYGDTRVHAYARAMANPGELGFKIEETSSDSFSFSQLTRVPCTVRIR